MTNSSTLADYKNRHAGEIIIVCGCGASLNEFKNPQDFITIGVNDVGRLFTPDYLVVLNPPQQFKGDRFQYVRNSKARAIFTQLDLKLKHLNVVRIKLGKRGGTDFSDPTVLHYTQNSPYVALCLAAHLGAKRIGLIGVDFTDHHFFAKTGRHHLTRQLSRIDGEYNALGRALEQLGIEVVNLSRESRLTAFRKVGLEEFVTRKLKVRENDASQHNRRKEAIPRNRRLNNDSIGDLAPNIAAERSKATSKKINQGKRIPKMKIAIEKRKPGIVGDFLDVFVQTATQLGHSVTRNIAELRQQKEVISVVWNGRRHRFNGITLYCEHGWLPRWEYQISPRGINADSHFAPFQWDGEPLTTTQKKELERHLEEIRQGGPANYQYMQTNFEAITRLPEAFFLVPLQMEGDTNIQRHVPPHFRRIQCFIDFIERSNPPYPIIFKQHPADVRRGNQQLRLRLNRRQDVIRSHDSGNIHQILKSGRCKGIFSLNSNVVHDGLIWGIPSIVLGKNIWPVSGKSPFMHQLPERWEEMFAFFAQPETEECRDAYAYYLMKIQWKLEDMHNKEKVSELLDSLVTYDRDGAINTKAKQGKPVMASAKRSETVVPPQQIAFKQLVNIVALNKGWFFEDLKQHFAQLNCPEVTISASEKPLKHADVWIFPRTREAANSPDKSRTIVHIHDMYDNGYYTVRGDRRVVEECAGLVLTHPLQKTILGNHQIDIADKKIICRPIGYMSTFQMRSILPKKFTIAWIGRPVKHNNIDIKRVRWLIDALKTFRKTTRDFHVAFVGERLEKYIRQLRTMQISHSYYHRARYNLKKYPKLYQMFDCVVICSSEGAGSLPLYEGLATGLPVISTPVGWAPELIRNGENGYLVNTVGEVAVAIKQIYQDREKWFEKRHQIRESIEKYTMESWLQENIDLALKIIE